ncbi:MAG TPA: site-specific DNA-methyltransferase [Chitinispirillaceae bacterium]|nr:site-specific DNA-methyltransferase [Chitinispirillaceae bacterium]
MISTHSIQIADSRNLPSITSDSINLVVTSPPYPMIQMWDGLFSSQTDAVKHALETGNGADAFELMHLELDKVWREMFRVLKNGSFICINIGDAVRSISDRFSLYPNHSRIIASCQEIGFDPLPVILWRKQTNAPNKFMGSGMLPAGAYVTLEHEYILIFRKGTKREFKHEEEKLARMRSALFWEERNVWFSDLWDFKGTRQSIENAESRKRSAAYPFELAYRIINMYSLYNDTILDPFMGTGTTTLAAISSGRSSIGIEIDPAFKELIENRIQSFIPTATDPITNRIASHIQFISEYSKNKDTPKYLNANHGFPVITRQETELQLFSIAGMSQDETGATIIDYEPLGKYGSQPPGKKLRSPEGQQISLF